MFLPLALLIDWWLGEPKWLYQRVPHPIVLIGGMAGRVEVWLNRERHKLLAGGVGWLIVVGANGLVGWGVQGALLWLFGPWGWLLVAVFASAFIAFKSLAQHVRRVAVALDLGLDQGREAVSHIVGRDPQSLDGPGVARASIESLAENFSDGVIAPLFWLALGGLPGIMVYKAVNTLDSMWGHRSPRFERFGKIAARIDDAANWIPARLSGLIVVAACIAAKDTNAGEAWRAMVRDAAKHNSPNAGWPEAAMAGGLGILIAGPRLYDGKMSDAPFIGQTGGRDELTALDVHHALRLYRNCGFVTLALCFGGGIIVGALCGPFFF